MLILAVIGLVAGGVFGFVRARNDADSAAPEVPVTFYDRVVPGLCAMEAQLADGKRTEAYNTFWNEVHLPAHALAAELLNVDRAETEKFQRAKLAVEQELATLAPGLADAVVEFEQQARVAVVAVGRPEPVSCG